MNIKDFQESLDYMHKAEITPFVWGHAGIGKTSIVRQYAKDKGYKFFPLYLGTQSDVGDILGLASFIKDENGSEIATSFAPPIWLTELLDYCNKNPNSGAVLFLDEFNRGRRDIVNGMFSLALDKKFHTIQMPKNCFIVAAGNPPTEEYYVNDVNETALMARFTHIKLEPTFQEWVAFAIANNIESTLVSFLQDQPTLLEDAKSDFTLPVKTDRRAFERIDRLFKVKTPTHILYQLMAGTIGLERVVAYQAHLQNSDKLLTGEEVLTGARLDTIKKWSNPVDIKSSMLSGTCDNVVAYLTDKVKATTTLTDDEGENLTVFAETLPRDVSYPMFMKLVHAETKWFRAYNENPKFKQRLLSIVKEAKGKK